MELPAFIKKNAFICLVFLSVSFSYFQVVLSKNTPLLYQNEVDLIEQQQRMNDYPSMYYRLANIIEKRPESRLFFKLQDNFFSIFDIKSLPFLIIFLILIGFFDLVQKGYLKYFLPLFIIPVLTLTFVGSNATVGNFCLYPVLFIFAINGFLSIAKK
ncbi:MAG: hypothetical protein WC841_05915 [Candidatus Shapirobacteria bacterium]|jgi:hypothetical protein